MTSDHFKLWRLLILPNEYTLLPLFQGLIIWKYHYKKIIQISGLKKRVKLSLVHKLLPCKGEVVFYATPCHALYCILFLIKKKNHPLLVSWYFNLPKLFGSPTYNVSVTRLRVGATLIDSDFTALFDSGTSFTYLVDPAYARLSQSVSNHYA